MSIHYIRTEEIETLRENIDALCMALEPSAVEGDFDAERDARELLGKVEER